MSREFDRAYWEDRYSGHTAGHDARPNPQFLAELDGLAAGRALDAGCGEGANALWLASHGWQVTAVDIAGAALDRARAQAEGLDAGITGRIEWLQADLTAWTPPAAHFDLVTAHYVHPASPYETLLRGLAEAVAPGGTLLVLDHAASHQPPSHQPASEAHASYASHGPPPHVHRTAQEAAAALDPGRWEVVVAEARTTTVTGPHGRESSREDAVLRAVRRS